MTSPLASTVQTRIGTSRSRRTAVVSTVTATEVKVRFADTEVVVDGFLGSYYPIVGDVVILLREESSWLLLGNVAGSTQDLGTADVRYTRTVVQSIANNSAVKVAFTGLADTATDVTVTSDTDFALNRAGLWLLSAQFIFAAGTVGPRILIIAKSTDSSYKYAITNVPSASEVWLNATTVVRLVTGQSVSVYAYQASGGALNIGGTGTGECVFAAAWLRS